MFKKCWQLAASCCMSIMSQCLEVFMIHHQEIVSNPSYIVVNCCSCYDACISWCLDCSNCWVVIAPFNHYLQLIFPTVCHMYIYIYIYIYISNKIIPTYSHWSWIFLAASPQRPGWSMLSWLCPWPPPWPWPPWLRCCKTSARRLFPGKYGEALTISIYIYIDRPSWKHNVYFLL